MKKVLSMILVLMMVTALFAGCGQEEDTTGNDTTQDQKIRQQIQVVQMILQILMRQQIQRVLMRKLSFV